MPRTGPIVTPFLSSLISNKEEYRSVPTADELESLKASLTARALSVTNELERAKEAERILKKQQFKKRKEAGDEEAAALAANAQAGAKLEALERARTEGLAAAAAAARKGSPAGPVKVKRERNSASPVPSNASSSGFKPPAPVVTYGGQHTKKKKKQRLNGSDDERPRDRSTTIPSPPHAQSTSVLKLKVPTQPKTHPPPSILQQSPAPSTSTSSAGAIDFSLHPQPSRPLVPPRPGVQKPLEPGPKRQSEVDKDFSDVKPGNQVAFPTFWNSVEPYLREIREDDLAMLGFKADAPESYEIPAKGRHYTEIWDEEDGHPLGWTPRASVPNMRPVTAVGHFVPANELREEALLEEGKGLGSLTERIVAAVVGDKDLAKKKKESVKGKPADDGLREFMKLDVVDMEEKVKRELRSVLLLGEHEERDDDEITSSLRQCQRLLLQQTTINEARKGRLAEIAKRRLAYTEYTTALEGIEKSIEAGWAKQIKKHGSNPKKSALSAGPSGRPPVPTHLKKMVATRAKWIEAVGAVMKGSEGEHGVGWLPKKSIYEGIGEEMEERDEKTVDDAVNVESGDEE